jgi:hypothetical protein
LRCPIDGGGSYQAGAGGHNRLLHHCCRITGGIHAGNGGLTAAVNPNQLNARKRCVERTAQLLGEVACLALA